jgi:tetratricopeptide (TPR) repeat protein
MTCEVVFDEKLLYEYVEGMLTDDRAEELEAHLETCSACREEEIRLRSLVVELETLALDSDPIEGLASLGVPDVSQIVRQCNGDSEMGKNITDRNISVLKIALAIRDFPVAQKLIDDHLVTLMTLDPDQKNAAHLVALFARWMDMGYAHVGMEVESAMSRLEMVKSRLRLFPQAPRELLCLRDIVHLRMASGYVALAEHRHENALADFSFVVAVSPEMVDRELAAMGHFAIAKVHRRRGEYDKAEPHVSEATRLAGEANRAEMVAGFSIMRAWLQFQKGDAKTAKELLFKAKAVLRRTEDHLRLGNIQSVLGRIAQREGRFHDALRNYGLALSEYEKWSPKHGNKGRTLVNRAFVSRLLALKTLKKGHECEAERGEAEGLRQNARTDLQESLCIYADLNHGRGQASVKVVSALLYLDSEDFDRAEREAEEAYQLGIEKMDMIVAARARIVQCMTENARASNSSRGSSQEDACMERALTCAGEAIALAEKTQNKRLQARTYIWRGLTLLRSSGDNYGAAWDCYDRGKSLLEPPGGSYAAEELHLLETELKLNQGSTQLGVVQGHKRSKVAPQNSTPSLFAQGREK